MKISPPGRLRRATPIAALALALGAFATGLVAQQGGGVPLNPTHPERYVVRPGDTLWGISAMFLRDPWYWPEIWQVNPQVRNPHLIFPGDVLTLVYVDGRPQLQLERGQAGAAAEAGPAGTGRLSPRVRAEPLTDAITTIPYGVIGPFLDRGMVLERREIDDLPHIVALRDGRLVGAAGNDLYVRGRVGEPASVYSVVHIGDRLVDPDNGDLLGYQGIYVGEGIIRRGGDPATLRLTASRREALEGDRLLASIDPPPLQFVPRAPGQLVDGRIIHVVDGVSMAGQYQVLVLNRGTRHGLEPGHVLSVWQAGDTVIDRKGRGPRNSPSLGGKVQLPDERAGVLMVFKTYDRISYGLVMNAEAPIHVLDRVRNPS